MSEEPTEEELEVQRVLAGAKLVSWRLPHIDTKRHPPLDLATPRRYIDKLIRSLMCEAIAYKLFEEKQNHELRRTETTPEPRLETPAGEDAQRASAVRGALDRDDGV